MCLDKLLVDSETAIGTILCLKDNVNALLPSEISPHSGEEQVPGKEVEDINRDEVSEMKLCVADLYVLGTIFKILATTNFTQFSKTYVLKVRYFLS